jgi:hypothetical protein
MENETYSNTIIIENTENKNEINENNEFEIDIISRIFKDVFSCKEFILGLLEFVKDQYKEYFYDYIYYFFEVSINSNDRVLMCSSFLILLDTEESIKNLIIEEYKDSIKYNKEFLNIFFKKLSCDALNLRSMPYEIENAYKYLEFFIDEISLAWTSCNIYSLKKNSKKPIEVSDRVTGCNILSSVKTH